MSQIKTEYYVSMLIRRFVSLRVACVKSYHARPKVERDMRLYTGNEKWYKPTDQYADVMFLLLYTFSITFLIVYIQKQLIHTEIYAKI